MYILSGIGKIKKSEMYWTGKFTLTMSLTLIVTPKINIQCKMYNIEETRGKYCADPYKNV